MNKTIVKAGTLVESVDCKGYLITVMQDTEAWADGAYVYFKVHTYPPVKWVVTGYNPL